MDLHSSFDQDRFITSVKNFLKKRNSKFKHKNVRKGTTVTEGCSKSFLKVIYKGSDTWLGGLRGLSEKENGYSLKFIRK